MPPKNTTAAATRECGGTFATTDSGSASASAEAHEAHLKRLCFAHSQDGWRLLGCRERPVTEGAYSASGKSKLYSRQGAIDSGLDPEGFQRVLAEAVLYVEKRVTAAAAWEAGAAIRRDEAIRQDAIAAEEASRAAVLTRISREFRRQTGLSMRSDVLSPLLQGVPVPQPSASIEDIRAFIPTVMALQEAQQRAEAQVAEAAAAARNRYLADRQANGPFSTDAAAAMVGVTPGSFRSAARRLGHTPAEVVQWSTGRASSRHDYVAHHWSMSTVQAIRAASAARTAKAGAVAEIEVAKAAIRKSRFPTAWQRLGMTGDDE